MTVLETDRLVLRRLTVEDDAFLLELLNDPAWLRFIGDKGVRTLEDARRYVETGPMDMYSRLGFGLYLVVRKSDGFSIGICGLIKREGLDDVDIGFAFLPAFRRAGYGREAATAVLAYGAETFGLKRIVAITSPGNEASDGLLEALGFRFERTLPLPPTGEPVRLFAFHQSPEASAGSSGRVR